MFSFHKLDSVKRLKTQKETKMDWEYGKQVIQLGYRQHFHLCSLNLSNPWGNRAAHDRMFISNMARPCPEVEILKLKIIKYLSDNKNMRRTFW